MNFHRWIRNPIFYPIELRALIKRVSINGKLFAFQAKSMGSIPITRNLLAKEGNRTLNFNLGKVILYQLSYFRNIYIAWLNNIKVMYGTANPLMTVQLRL